MGNKTKKIENIEKIGPNFPKEMKIIDDKKETWCKNTKSEILAFLCFNVLLW